jgi:hypothetical protein
MTNKEALIAALQISVEDATLIKALIDLDVDGSETYSKVNATAIDKCAIEVLQGILSMPDVSEGGYSVKYDRKAVESRLSFLSQKTGVADPLKPTINDASNRW